MTALKYEKFTEARAHLKYLLDAAMEGRVAAVARENRIVAFVDQAQFVRFLRSLNADRVSLMPDEDGWLAVVTDAPIAGEGDTAADAVDDLIDALRDYADDWVERLRHAPNHEPNWGLVQLVGLSTDDELRGWVSGSSAKS